MKLFVLDTSKLEAVEYVAKYIMQKPTLWDTPEVEFAMAGLRDNPHIRFISKAEDEGLLRLYVQALFVSLKSTRFVATRLEVADYEPKTFLRRFPIPFQGQLIDWKSLVDDMKIS